MGSSLGIGRHVKYHYEIIEDRYIRDAAMRLRILFRIEDLIEMNYGEEETSDIEIRVDGLLSNRVSKVVVYGKGIESICGYGEVFEDTEILFNCGKGNGFTVPEIYRVLELRIIKSAIKSLSVYLYYDREYLMLILSSGVALLLEGLEKSITIPTLENVLLIAHTHPKVYQPVFSRKDLMATLDVVSKRGLGSCVTAVGGSLCILREKAFTIEEYEKFELLINSLKMAARQTLEGIKFESLYVLTI